MAQLREITGSTFQQEVTAAGKPVIVDIWAPWCGPCKQMLPIVEKVADRFAGQINVVKLDADKNPELCNQFRVSGIPTLLLFSGTEVVGRVTGRQTEAELVRFIESNLTGR